MGCLFFLFGISECWEWLFKWVCIVLLFVGVLLLYLLFLIDLLYLLLSGSDFGVVLFNVVVYVLVVLGFNVVVGYVGLFDLGYVGFYVIGVYMVGVLGLLYGYFLLLFLFLFVVVVILVLGIILGVLMLWVCGDYLVIVMLGFGEIVWLIFINWGWVG